MSRHAAMFFASIVLAVNSKAIAQQLAVTQITLNAGSATDVTGVTSRAASVSPSLSVSLSPRFSLALAASGTHFENGGWSALAGGAAVARHPLGPLALKLDTRASFTETSYNRSYLTADLTPAVEVRLHNVTVFAGGHASSATNWVAQETQQTAQLPGPLHPPLARSGAHRRASTGWGHEAVYGARAEFPASDRLSVSLAVREERGRVLGETQVDRVATATLSRGLTSLMGSIGARESRDERTPIGSAALSLSITNTTSFDLSAGRYAANRLTGATGGHFVNAGLSIRLGGREVALPRPAGAPPLERGMTRLSIAARDAESVEIAGDFTRWAAAATQRSANGVWFVDLRIPPGHYRYAFRIDGKEWRTPEGVVTADDGFGGRSALLTVEQSIAGRGNK